MKVAFYTLGCRTNQFETQAMEKLFSQRGFQLVSWEEEADAYIVNSCTVTASSDRKTRHMVQRLFREHPFSVIALCGCMAQRADPEKLDLPVTVLGGNRNHTQIVDAVCEQLNNLSDGLCLAGRNDSGFELLPAGGMATRTRALLKIEDGCDYYCTYCAIPYARGHVRSIPPEAAFAEAARLAAEGYTEIVITGIEISAYGADIGYTGGLGALLAGICDAAKPARVSIGSLRPTVVTEEFCCLLQTKTNLCRHFHLSIQSGSTSVLGRMRRRYAAEDVRRAVELLRASFDDPNICGDVICGFCGETDEEFAETLAFARELKLGGLHVFPYSPREGTYAAKLPDDVPKAVKEKRCAELAQCSAENYGDYLAHQIGKTYSVILETPEDARTAGGYTENYLYADVKTERFIKGDVRSVRVVAVHDKTLLCEEI